MSSILQSTECTKLMLTDLYKCRCVLYAPNGTSVEIGMQSASVDYSPGELPEVRIEGFLKHRAREQERVLDLTMGSAEHGAMEAEKVIYHPPATIVKWKDGTKTVVKCDPRDWYNPGYGLALCYMKKALGNTSRALNDVLKDKLYKEMVDG